MHFFLSFPRGVNQNRDKELAATKLPTPDIVTILEISESTGRENLNAELKTSRALICGAAMSVFLDYFFHQT